MAIDKLKNINYERVYYYTLVSFAFVLPLSRAAVSLFVILLPLIWFFEGNYQNKLQSIWKNPILKALLLFLSYFFLTFLWSENRGEALHFLRLYAYWFAIFVIATSVDKKYIQTIITSFLLGMFLSELIAYGVFFELWSFKNATPANPSPVMFWIDYSVFMALTAILLLSRIFSNNYLLKEKIPMLLFFLSTTGNLFLGMGRTGQVALMAGIVVMLFIYLKPTIKSLFIGLFLIISIYGTAYTLSDTFKIRVAHAINDIELIKEHNYDSSWGIRVVYWMVTYDILKENPALGVGIGDYQTVIKEYIEKNNYPISKETQAFMISNHAHNQFLMTLIQTGLIGFILMLNIIYQILKMNKRDEELQKLASLFITIYFVSCMAEPLWLKQFTIALFILFVGLFSIEEKRISH